MSAVMSADQKYRYRLSRDIGMVGDGTCCFVMLNPSTADAWKDDPTIRRCVGYARMLNCEQLEVVNLFAYRSTDPDALYGMSKDAAIGPDNDHHILEACKASCIVVCAWGNHGKLFDRGADVLMGLRTHGLRPMAKERSCDRRRDAEGAQVSMILPEPSLSAWRTAVERLGVNRKNWRVWNPKYNEGRRLKYLARKGAVRRYRKSQPSQRRIT